MLEIEFHLQAEAEMLDAASYYEERATGLIEGDVEGDVGDVEGDVRRRGLEGDG